MRIISDSRAPGLQETASEGTPECSTQSEEPATAIDLFDTNEVAHPSYVYAAAAGASRAVCQSEIIEILPRAQLTQLWWEDLSLLVEKLPPANLWLAGEIKIEKATMESICAMALLSPHRAVRA